MGKYVTVKVNDFTSGENKTASPDNLTSSEVRHMENADPLLRGGTRIRFGTVLKTTVTTTAGIDRLIYFEYANATGVRILKKLALLDNKLIDMDTEATIKSGLTDHLDYEVMDNKLYVLSNGEFFSYDGTTAVDITTSDTPAENMLPEVKKCKYLEQRGERLYASGNPEAPSHLYYSEILSPDKWYTPDKTIDTLPAGVNPIRAVSDDGDPITALREFHGALLVFKTRTIFAWFGVSPMDDVVFKRLDVHAGAISYRSIVKMDNYLFFMGRGGIWALKGLETNAISTIKVSSNIKPLIDDITIGDEYFRSPIVGIVSDDKYLLAVPSEGTTNNLILVFHFYNWINTGREAWSHYTGLAPKEMIVDYSDDLLFADWGTGDVVEASRDYTNDRGEAIYSKINLSPFGTLGVDAFVIKKFKALLILSKQYEALKSTYTVSGFVDYMPFSSEVETDESGVYDEAIFGSSVWDFSELVSRYMTIKLKGKRLDMTIETTELDSVFLLYAVGVVFKNKKVDKTSSVE